MGLLQEELESALSGLPWRFLTDRVVEQLQEQSIVLSSEDRTLLEEYLRAGAKGVLTLQPSQSQEIIDVTLELTAEDGRAVTERLGRFLEHGLPKLVGDISDQIAVTLLETLLKRWRRESKRQASEIAGFRARLEQHWREPLELLRLLLTIARDWMRKLMTKPSVEHPPL